MTYLPEAHLSLASHPILFFPHHLFLPGDRPVQEVLADQYLPFHPRDRILANQRCPSLHEYLEEFKTVNVHV